MAAHFLLQIFQRFTQHIGHNANAGYHKQKVRHGFHLLSTEVLRNSVQPAATQWSAFHCRQTKLNHIYCCPSIPFHAIIETTISKGKKFSYSFIGGKGYSPPSGGRIAFCLQSEAGCARLHLCQSPPRIKVLLMRAILCNFPYVKKSPLRTRTPQRGFFYYPSFSTAHTVSTPSLTVNRTFFPANATPYTRSGSLW